MNWGWSSTARCRHQSGGDGLDRVGLPNLRQRLALLDAVLDAIANDGHHVAVITTSASWPMTPGADDDAASCHTSGTGGTVFR
jgi:hypothetical protein